MRGRIALLVSPDDDPDIRVLVFNSIMGMICKCRFG